MIPRGRGEVSRESVSIATASQLTNSNEQHEFQLWKNRANST